jgi:hypothetical protein
MGRNIAHPERAHCSFAMFAQNDHVCAGLLGGLDD